MSIDLSIVARELKLPINKIENAVSLLDDGNTIPFITRFRKDQTGGLNEKQLLAIQRLVSRARALADRRNFVIKSIESQGKLTDELRQGIEQALSLRQIEDFYLPFKPRKQTLATIARQAGLEPFAGEILDGKSSEEDLASMATNYVRVDKGLNSVDEVFENVGFIIAERFSDAGALRAELRKVFWETGGLVAQAASEPAIEAPTSPTVEVASDKKAVAAIESSPAPVTSEQVESVSPANDSVQAATETSSESDSTVASTGDLNPVPPEDRLAAKPQMAKESVGTVVASNEANEKSQTPVGDSDVQAGEPASSKVVGASSATDSPQAAATLATKKPKKKKKKKKKIDDPFKDFYDFKQPVNKLPHHRVLAINRGERSGKLKVKIAADEAKMLELSCSILVPEDHPFKEFLKKCVVDALNRLVLPSLEREVRRELTEQAEKHAVEVFSSNLKHLLLQPPTQGKMVLAIDPGFKRGCSVAVVKPSGEFVESAHVFVVGNKARRDESIGKLADLVQRHSVDLIAIGNGTACRETEQIVSNLIAEKFSDRDLRYVMVNEAGASVYSTSEIGLEEFPSVTPNVRSAISIGRRLIDPISELVKISPANIGVGMYQHDVKAKHLSESLDQVVQFCVNRVGVNVNTASPSLLRFVSGLNQLTARRIYEYRQENGPFPNREKLKEVTGFGQSTFVQAAGFLRINDGNQPLDSTSIHPESYEIAEKIIEQVDADRKSLFPQLVPAISQSAKAVDATKLAGTSKQVPVEASEASPSAEKPVASVDTEPSVPEAKATEPNSGSVDVEPVVTEPVVTEPILPDASVVQPEAAGSALEDSTLGKTATEPTSSDEADAAEISGDNADDAVAAVPVEVAAAGKETPVPADEATLDAAKKARQEVVGRIKAVDPQSLADKFMVGNFLIKDIVNNLIRPRRDPRDGVSRPILRRGIIKVDDLKPGMMLDGQVVNVVDFGVFVDIGLGESCLVHVSQLSNRYISDPHQLFAVGEVIKVWVNEIDSARRRVKLTAINPKIEQKPKESRRRPRQTRQSTPTGRKDGRGRETKRQRSSERTQTTRVRRTPKPVKPITKGMLEGKEPMRSFSDLLQFVEKKPEDSEGDKK